MSKSYSQINLPIIFVAGDKEQQGIQYTLKKVPEIIKPAETTLIPNAEHQWPVQLSDVFNSFLEKWLKNK